MNLLRIRTETSDCELPLVKIEVCEHCTRQSLVELVVKNVGFSREPIFVTTQLEGALRKLRGNGLHDGMGCSAKHGSNRAWRRYTLFYQFNRDGK